jgi:glucose-1-phosphatase
MDDLGLVLFDLGGVLIELGGVGSLQDLSGIESAEEIWRRWLDCRWVRRFESGHCSPEEFSAGVVGDWDLPVTPEEFLDLFRDWPIGPFEGATELLAEVRRNVPIGCLSNTNVVHWGSRAEDWPLLGQFDYRFLSFELGRVKPDPIVFELVADSLPCGRNDVLLLDDVAFNVEAARTAGFRSEQVGGVDDCRRLLAELGVLR